MKHSQFGYHKLPWYRSMFCSLRFHSGTWQYEANSACNQFRVCEACGRTQTRVWHDWDRGRGGTLEFRTCNRCGKTETWGGQSLVDNLRDGLIVSGIEATVSRRLPGSEGLIGVIDIHHSPISCVEVMMSRDYEGVTFSTRYVVPDSRLIKIVTFRSVRVRTFPVFGRVIGVRWEGDDKGTGAMGRLTADSELQAAIISARAEIAVASSGAFRWFITHTSADASSSEVFACYEKVARDLIRTK